MGVVQLLSKDSFIMVNKTLMREVGVNAAILCGAFCSYQSRFDKDFFQTQEEISEDTTLSKYEIMQATKKLEETGILKIEKRGLPCRNYYRIDEIELAKLLENSSKKIKKSVVKNFDFYIDNSINNNLYDRNKKERERNAQAREPAHTRENAPLKELPTKPKKERSEEMKAFFEAYPQVVIDNYSAALNSVTAEDWIKIKEAFDRSAFLRDSIKTLTQLCRMIKRIIAGEFDDFKTREEIQGKAELERRRKWIRENIKEQDDSDVPF